MTVTITANGIELPDGSVIKSVVGDVADGGIVESGSNANGSWTKWADGTMEITKSIPITTPIQTAAGAIFLNAGSSPVEVGDYPIEFISPPVEVAVAGSASGNPAGACWVIAQAYPTTSVGGKYYFARQNSTASTPYELRVIAKGRWKA